MQPETRRRSTTQNRREQQEIREQFENRAGTQLLTYEEAHPTQTAHRMGRASHCRAGIHRHGACSTDFPLAELVPFIDWSPFFHTWEMRGRYPDLLNDPARGPAARELFADAQELLQEIVDEKLFTAHGVYGFFPANSDGDDIIVYTDATRTNRVGATAHIAPAEGQSTRQAAAAPWPTLSRRATAAHVDYIGAFAVTDRPSAPRNWRNDSSKRQRSVQFDHGQSAGGSIGRSVRRILAQARARDWGYGKREKLSHEDLIQEKYRGIRPAPGYPAAARSHREAAHLRSAASRRGDRHHAHRKLRHVSGGVGLRPLFRSSRSDVISPSVPSARTKSSPTPCAKG